MSYESPAFELAMEEVLAIPQCSRKERYDELAVYFETPLFYIRVLQQEEEILIQLGVKETFDRWANSTNFVTSWDTDPELYHSPFRPQYDWAVKVVKSGLFDFNTYFSTIEMPRFDCVKGS